MLQRCGKCGFWSPVVSPTQVGPPTVARSTVAKLAEVLRLAEQGEQERARILATFLLCAVSGDPEVLRRPLPSLALRVAELATYVVRASVHGDVSKEIESQVDALLEVAR